jgi:molybdate transport system substrate-binding protein
MNRISHGLWFACILALSYFADVAAAAEVKVLSSTGVSAAMRELLPKFESTSGHKISVSFALAGDVKKQIDGGEAFDLAIVSPPIAAELVKAGKADAASVADVARLGVGVAVKSGSAKPDIGSAEAFKQAVLNAKSVIYTRGGSGTHFEGLLTRFGISDQVKAKSKQVSGGEAIPAVAKGEVELGIDVIPQIVAVPGVDLVGPLPGDLQIYVLQTAVISSSAKEPAAAKALLDFIKSPAGASVLKAKGMEPG